MVVKGLLQFSFEGLGRLDSHHSFHLFPVSEQDKRGDRIDSEVSRSCRVLVGIEFDDTRVPVEFSGEPLEYRGLHAAGAAPGSPEIDQYGT